MKELRVSIHAYRHSQKQETRYTYQTQQIHLQWQKALVSRMDVQQDPQNQLHQ